MTASLGIDPGVTGGAVLLAPDGVTALQAWGWRRMGRSKKRAGRHCWRVMAPSGLETEAPTLSAVGAWMAYTCPVPTYVLTVEGLFGRGETLRILGESAGVLYSHLELGALNDLSERKAGTLEWRPRSRTWRSDILGISESQTGADGAEALALRTVPTWCSGLGELATNGHVAEAACMARWGWLKNRARVGA